MELIIGNMILALLCAQPAFSTTVDVSVHGFTSRNGVLNVSIWKNVKGFPKKS